MRAAVFEEEVLLLEGCRIVISKDPRSFSRRRKRQREIARRVNVSSRTLERTNGEQYRAKPFYRTISSPCRPLS